MASAGELTLLDKLATALPYLDVTATNDELPSLVARGVDDDVVIDVTMELLERATFLVIRSNYVATIPDQRVPVLTDLLVRINIGLGDGHFEVDADNTVVFCSDVVVTDDVAGLAGEVVANVAQLSEALAAIDDVAFADSTALDAFASI